MTTPDKLSGCQHCGYGLPSELIEDPVEKTIARALRNVGVRFTHEKQNKEQALDFYLPDHKCYIECKAFYTDRTGKQIEGKQVIVIQGYEAAKVFASLLHLNKHPDDWKCNHGFPHKQCGSCYDQQEPPKRPSLTD